MTQYDRIALGRKKRITGDVRIAPPYFYNWLFKVCVIIFDNDDAHLLSHIHF